MLTHINKNNQPCMVDITSKENSIRMAQAYCQVILPSEISKLIHSDELNLKKGPVFQTAMISGTMAVKKTYELIPFCHQILIENISFDIKHLDGVVHLTCTVKTSGKTGVEMEAIHGVMNAAMTIYDMCKGISHHITISGIQLLQKTGGKRLILDKPTYGLVLTGGQSKRMQQDKALLSYHGRPHAIYIHDILSDYCDDVYVSARRDQWKGTELEEYKTIADESAQGPIDGIISAFNFSSDVNWLIVACDLIHFNHKTVQTLLSEYQKDKTAIGFSNREKGFLEPLCTLYTPEAKGIFEQAKSEGITCPVKVLKSCENVISLEQSTQINLANINTREEFHEAQNEKF